MSEEKTGAYGSLPSDDLVGQEYDVKICPLCGYNSSYKSKSCENCGNSKHLIDLMANYEKNQDKEKDQDNDKDNNIDNDKEKEKDKDKDAHIFFGTEEIPLTETNISPEEVRIIAEGYKDDENTVGDDYMEAESLEEKAEIFPVKEWPEKEPSAFDVSPSASSLKQNQKAEPISLPEMREISGAKTLKEELYNGDKKIIMEEFQSEAEDTESAVANKEAVKEVVEAPLIPLKPKGEAVPLEPKGEAVPGEERYEVRMAAFPFRTTAAANADRKRERERQSVSVIPPRDREETGSLRAIEDNSSSPQFSGSGKAHKENILAGKMNSVHLVQPVLNQTLKSNGPRYQAEPGEHYADSTKPKTQNKMLIKEKETDEHSSKETNEQKIDMLFKRDTVSAHIWKDEEIVSGNENIYSEKKEKTPKTLVKAGLKNKRISDKKSSFVRLPGIGSKEPWKKLVGAIYYLVIIVLIVMAIIQGDYFTIFLIVGLGLFFIGTYGLFINIIKNGSFRTYAIALLLSFLFLFVGDAFQSNEFMEDFRNHSQPENDNVISGVIPDEADKEIITDLPQEKKEPDESEDVSVDPDLEPDPNIEPDTETVPDQEADPDIKPYPDTDPDLEPDTDADQEPEPDPDEEKKPEIDTSRSVLFD